MWMVHSIQWKVLIRRKACSVNLHLKWRQPLSGPLKLKPCMQQVHVLSSRLGQNVRSPCLPFKFLKTSLICQSCATIQSKVALQLSSVHWEHLPLQAVNRNGQQQILTYSLKHSEPAQSKPMMIQLRPRSVLLKPMICELEHGLCPQLALPHRLRTSFRSLLLLRETSIQLWLLPRQWMHILATALQQ